MVGFFDGCRTARGTGSGSNLRVAIGPEKYDEVIAAVNAVLGILVVLGNCE